jgi:hypothetical protein
MTEKLTIRSLAGIAREQRYADLLSLPLPDESDLKTSSPATAFAIATEFYGTWTTLLKAGPKSVNVTPKAEERDAAWLNLVQLCAAYYDLAHWRLSTSGLPTGKSLIPGMAWAPVEEMVGHIKEGDPPLYLVAQILSLDYLIALKGIYFAETFVRLPSASLTFGLPFSAITARVVAGMFDRIRLLPPGGRLQELGGYLLHSLLRRQAEMATAREADQPPPLLVGPFSAIRPDELSLLAARDSAMAARYRGRALEKVFEQQLALLAQSLGFFVVATRTGASTVDLICISSDPTAPYTCLVEAKTTRGRYSLPTKDARALRDYVAEVRRSLATLPPLRFALIIGPEPTRTVERKLIALEAAVGLPVRYVRAIGIAKLRHSLPGPAPLGPLADTILSAAHLLPDDFSRSVADFHERSQEAHREFVQAMMQTPIAIL